MAKSSSMSKRASQRSSARVLQADKSIPRGPSGSISIDCVRSVFPPRVKVSGARIAFAVKFFTCTMTSYWDWTLGMPAHLEADDADVIVSAVDLDEAQVLAGGRTLRRQRKPRR